MGEIRSFYRKGTPDLPLDIAYYSPALIRQIPGYSESSSRMTVTWMQAGQVEMRVDGKCHIILPGDIFIFLPYEIYTFRTMTMDTRYISMEISKELIAMPPEHFFQKEFVEPLWKGLLRVPRWIRPGDPGYDAMLRQLGRLDVTREGSEAYRGELFSAVIGFCTALMPLCAPIRPEDRRERAEEDVVYRCLEYIKNNYSRKLTLGELAELVHLQPNYLCSVFKDRTGRTVFEHITRYRCSWAAKLLRSTKLPVNQIAERCGFPSISFFTRKFTALHGGSPTDYRKRFARRETEDMDGITSEW